MMNVHNIGDWIDTGLLGDRYARKPDNFENSYEKTEE